MEKHILVIDDDPAVRKSFQLALKKTGYQVDTAESGPIGLDMFEKKPYDLIYLDLRMPEMDGVQVLHGIREKNLDVPVYIVTAFHREFFASLAEARKQGLSFDLLRKPIERQHVIAITRGILEGAVDQDGE